MAERCWSLPSKSGKHPYGLSNGYGSHTTMPTVNTVDELGCDLRLRVPRTRHVSQVADVAILPKFKRLAKEANSDMLVDHVLNG